MLRVKFLGGFNVDSVLKFSKNILKFNKIPVINYAIEEKYMKENNYNTYLELIKKTSSENVIAIKFSSFDFDKKLIKKLVKSCIERNLKIFIDAECNEYNKKYNSLSNSLIEEYNKDKVNLFKTYQMYRKDSLSILKNDYEHFQNINVNFGIKLVRGAYWNSEKNTGSLFTNKLDTNLSYNNAIFYLHNKKKTDVVLATHNFESINLAILFNKNMNSKFKFAHLLDMNSKVHDSLSKENKVYVYIPFGPITKMLPYLLRRLYENIDSIKYMV